MTMFIMIFLVFLEFFHVINTRTANVLCCISFVENLKYILPLFLKQRKKSRRIVSLWKRKKQRHTVPATVDEKQVWRNRPRSQSLTLCTAIYFISLDGAVNGIVIVLSWVYDDE